MTLDAPLSAWRDAGAAAYRAGAMLAPAADPAVRAALDGVPVGDPRTVPALRAWSDGWTAANLAAEQEPADA